MDYIKHDRIHVVTHKSLKNHREAQGVVAMPLKPPTVKMGIDVDRCWNWCGLNEQTSIL